MAILESVFKITTDESAVNKTLAKIKALESNLERLDKETDSLTNATEKQRAQFDRTTKALDEYRAAVRQVGRTGDAAEKDIEALNAALGRTQTTLKGIKQEGFDRTFSDVSNQVAAAGDVQSNLGALGGLAGAAGAGGVSSGLGIAGELIVLTEELPRLKTALSGLPATIASAAAALGPVGLGLAAVAAIAGGTFLVASNKLKKLEEQARAATDAIQAQTAAQTDIEVLTSRGQYEEAIQKFITLEDQYNANLRRQANARADIREQEARRDREDAEQNAFEGFIDRFGGITNTSTERILNDLEEDFKETEQTTLESQAALEGAEQALRAVGVTEEEIAEYRREVLTRQQQEQRTAIDAEFEAREALLPLYDQTTDAIQSQIETTQEQIMFLQEQAAEYETAGLDTADLTSQIEALRQREQALTSQVLPAVQAREAETEAIRRNEEALEAAEQRREEVTRAEQQYTQDQLNITQRALEQQTGLAERYNEQLVDIAEQRAEAEVKALENLQDERAKAQLDLERDTTDAIREQQQDRYDLLLDFQREEAKAARDHADTLEDIQKNANRSIEDALAENDFASVFDIQRQTQRELEDATTQAAREARERGIGQREDTSDLERQFERERTERLIAYDRQLTDAKTAYEKELQAAAQAQADALIEAREAYQRQQQQNIENYQRQLEQREQAQAQELDLIRNGDNARLRLQQEYQRQTIALQQQLLAQASQQAAQFPGGFGRSFNSPRSRPTTRINNTNSSTNNSNNDNRQIVVGDQARPMTADINQAMRRLERAIGL